MAIFYLVCLKSTGVSIILLIHDDLFFIDEIKAVFVASKYAKDSFFCSKVVEN